MLKYLIILIATNCIAQSHYKLGLNVTSTTGAFDYQIGIQKKGKTSTIYYSNISEKRLPYDRKDSIRVNNLFNKKFRTAKENQEIEFLINKYKTYDKDSLIVSNEELLIQLSDSLFKSYKIILEEKNSNNYPISIDESIVNISLNGDKHFKVYGPNDQKYIIIYCMLKEAMLIYKNSAEKPIFPKTYMTY